MKKIYLLVIVVLSSLNNVISQTTLYTEGFETDGEGTRYTSSTFNQCTPGGNPDYFLRTNTNPVLPPGTCTVGFGNALTNLQGSFFWAGEDIRSSTCGPPGCLGPGSITTQNISIAGYTSLIFSLYLATASNNNVRWETSDSINLKASIDGGPFITFGRFVGDAPAGGRLRIDTNLDGIGEGTAVDQDAFAQYSFPISGTGNNIQIRVEYYQLGGTEESAVDQFQLTGIFTGGPEINVQGNSTNILDGDITPSTTDHTDFGSVGVCSSTFDRTFTIQNTGTSNLTISSTTITGAGSADYSIITAPTSPVAAGVSTTMVVRFNPSSTGPRNATVTINNNDANESVYDFAITGNGVEPEINVQGNSTNIVDGDVTPTTIDFTDFGSQSVCSGTIVRTFTIQNSGTSNLSVTAVNITGTHASDFTLTALPTNPVAAAGNTTFQITFNPSANGIRSATINISNGDCDESTYDFAIQGTGTDPEINIQSGPTSVLDGDATPSIAEGTDFGGTSVCAGPTLTSTLTIYNTGNANLVISSINVTGPGFSLSGISLPATILPGSNTTFNVNFGPTNLGPLSGSVVINNNDCNEATYDFSIQGTGQDPEMNMLGNGTSIGDGDITPTTTDHTDFGNQAVCIGSITRTFTIQNLGFGTPLNIAAGGITITGAGASQFTLGGISLPASIPAFNAATFTVTYNPSVTGISNATITITNNDCDETVYDFAIQGNGTDPEINVKGNGNNIPDGNTSISSSDNTDIGIQSICSGSITKTFVIENTGTSTLNISGVTFSGAGAADFSVITPPSSTIGAGLSSSFTISFNPSSYGMINATVNISNSDCDEGTYDFAILGFGTDPELNITGNSVNIVDGDVTPSTTDFTDFGNTNVCSGSINRVFGYENLLGGTLNLLGITITGANASDFSIVASPPLSITGAGATVFTINFNPSASGLRTATINIATNDCDESTYNFDIQGTGDPDATPPNAICQNISINLNASGNAGILASQVDNGSNDACGSVTLSVTPNTFTCANIGSNNVVLTVTDASGNTATCNSTVTITDNIAPTVITQNITAYLDNVGTANITATQINNGSTDNCTVSSLNVSPSTFNCANIGNNTVILTVTDQSGNTSTSTATVNIVDTVFPVLINIPSDIYINATDTSCGEFVNWVPPTPMDNCSGVWMGSSHNPGDYFPVGTTSVGYITMDASGNMGGGGFNIIVTDSAAPIPDITNLPDITGTCNATVTSTPNATDNCAGNIVGTTTDPLSYSSQGTFTITWNYNDGNGNISTQTQHVIISDNIIPVISAMPGDTTLYTDPGLCSTTYSWSIPSAGDNCNLQSLSGNANPGDNFTSGAHLVIYTATDNAGNTSTDSFTITVVDNEPPVFNSCPANINGCENEIINYPVPTGTDNCSSTTISYSGPGSGTIYPVGTTTNTYILMDAAGNADTCSFTVTILPAPTVSFNCPTDSICITSGSITLAGIPSGGTFSGPGITGNDFDPGVAGIGIHNITYSFTDTTGCENSNSDSILVLGCTATQTISEEELVIIYPNPTYDLLNIDLGFDNTEIVQIQILNTLGQLVYNGLMQGRIAQIKLGHLSNGTYVLNINGVKFNTVKKVILK